MLRDQSAVAGVENMQLIDTHADRQGLMGVQDRPSHHVCDGARMIWGIGLLVQHTH